MISSIPRVAFPAPPAWDGPQWPQPLGAPRCRACGLPASLALLTAWSTRSGRWMRRAEAGTDGHGGDGNVTLLQLSLSEASQSKSLAMPRPKSVRSLKKRTSRIKKWTNWIESERIDNEPSAVGGERRRATFDGTDACAGPLCFLGRSGEKE